MSAYVRTTPLPPMTDKCGKFYIRYEVDRLEDGLACLLDAEVWEVCEWASDGGPVFWNAGPNAPGIDPTKLESLFTLRVKFDGCSHLHMRYFHFDTLEELGELKRCIEYIHQDVCDREGVGD